MNAPRCFVEKNFTKDQMLECAHDGTKFPYSQDEIREGLIKGGFGHRFVDLPEKYGDAKGERLTDPFFSRGLGLFIHGGVGRGKTTLCALLAKEYYLRHPAFLEVVGVGKDLAQLVCPPILRFATPSMVSMGVREATDGLRQPWGGEGGNKHRQTPVGFLREYSKCRVLFLDELGRDLLPGFELRNLQAVIYARYDEGLQTVYASNYSLEELAGAGQLGGHVVSRIQETCRIIHMNGPDYREPAIKINQA